MYSAHDFHHDIHHQHSHALCNIHPVSIPIEAVINTPPLPWARARMLALMLLKCAPEYIIHVQYIHVYTCICCKDHAYRHVSLLIHEVTL